MARIIDKEEKRCDIARASIDLFCEKGIVDKIMTNSFLILIFQEFLS